MKLGLLDVHNRLGDTLALAPAADAVGYARYWLTEFPPMPSPLVVASIVAGLTDRIRVGTGAILLNYYAPRRTAHDFQLLDRLFDHRIDAGVSSSSASFELIRDDVEVGRAQGRDHHEMMLATYPERFATFLRHLRNTEGNPAYQRDLAWAGADTQPPTAWSLGSARAGVLAAKHGTGFGYALMYPSSVDSPDVMARYRDEFVAFAPGDRPTTVVAICGACDETDAAAEVEMLAFGGKNFLPRIVGSAASCAERLAALRARYGADEIVFADLHPTLESRMRGHALLAEAAARIPELQ